MGCNCGHRREIGRRIVSAMRERNYPEARRQMAAMSTSAMQDITALTSRRVKNPTISVTPPRRIDG